MSFLFFGRFTHLNIKVTSPTFTWFFTLKIMKNHALWVAVAMLQRCLNAFGLALFYYFFAKSLQGF